MRKTICLSMVIYSCMFLLLTGGPARAAVFNAQFVRCVIPETLTTDEIFPAVICMRNTGDTAWPIADILMYSRYPDTNYTWGAYFILQHDAKFVAPGDTFNFTSNLRAPSTPGKRAFAWQCYYYKTKQFFGETVPAESIYVQQRLETPPPPPPRKDSLLDSSDFEYAGSFKVPVVVGWDEHIYAKSGLSLRIMPDSTRHLFLTAGVPRRYDNYFSYKLYEVALPQLVKIAGNNFSALDTAPLVKNWGVLGWPTPAGDRSDLPGNGGFWWDNSTNILYWSIWHIYYMGSGFPMLSASRLENDTIINLKYWYLPIPRLKAWKGYWGGVTNLPRTFANAYAGGRDLALGFGGYYSICQPASCGPAIAAIHTPDILQDTLNDLLEVLRYVYPEAADRNGNYFAANENIWGYQPPNPWTGKFAYNSSCMTGVFVDLPDKKGYITFVKHNIGRIGYDWGGSVLDGHKENNWYFYDFKDLGEAALGNRAMGSVQPSSYVKIDYPAVSSATTVSGACFDPQTRIMYLYLTFALGSEPVVHAYHVKQSADARTEIMPPEKAGPVFVTQPNPFNPVTKIVLNSPLKLNGLEKAEIMIFNVRGKLVQRLLATNQQLSAGLAWDASNQPSGIYMLQVKIGGHLLMGRVSLIK